MRASIRQAEVHQRISQIHDPTGAAPAFEVTTTSTMAYYWQFNPGKSEEQRILYDMIMYLHNDPHTADTIAMLQFIIREWPIYEMTLQTKLGRDKLKRRLLELGIRYIHWNANTNDWSFWTTYNDDVMMSFYPTPKSQNQLIETRDTTPEKMSTPRQSQAVITVLNAQINTREPSENDTDEDIQEPPKYPTTYQRHLDSDLEEIAGIPDDDSDDESDWNTKMKPTPSTPQVKIEPMSEKQQVIPRLLTPKSMTSSMTSITGTKQKPYEIDDEGFATVPMRQSHLRQNLAQRTSSRNPPQKHRNTEQDSADTEDEDNDSFTDTPPSPYDIDLRTPPRHTPTPDLPETTLPSTDEFSAIINARRMHKVWTKMDNREHQLRTTLEEHEERMRILDRKQTNIRFHHLQKMTDYEERIQAWEATLEHRETQFERRMATVADIFTRERQQQDEYTQQTKLSVQAWTAASIASLQKDLAEHMDNHRTRVSAYCTDQMTTLEAHLETYTTRAQDTQADLLARLRTDMLETYGTTHTEAKLAHDTVGIDEDNQTKDSSIPAKASRWTHVDPAAWQTRDHTPTTSQPVPDTPDATREHFAGNHAPRQHTWTLAPMHPPRGKYAEHEARIARLRNANTPTHLRGRDRKAVQVFYNSFVDFHKTFRVPIKILDDVRIDRLDDNREQLYLDGLYENDPQMFHDYSAAIYARLEEENVLDPSESLYKGLLDIYNSRRNGYALLKVILAATLMFHAHDIGKLSTPPTAHPGMTPYEFAGNLNDFYRRQRQCDRAYTQMEQAMMFLQGMSNLPSFTNATQQLIHELKQIPPTIPLPRKYCYPALPQTLMAHPAAQQVTRTDTNPSRTAATINVAQVTMPSEAMRRAGHGRDGDRGNSRERDRRSHSVERRGRADGTRNPSQHRGHIKTERNLDHQCQACATNGHTHQDCRLLPKITAILEYITHNPGDAKDHMQQYKKQQSPSALKAAREKMIKVLQGRLSEDDDIDDIMDQLSENYTAGQNQDDHSASICHIATTPFDDTHHIQIIQETPPDTSADIQNAIHPIRYLDLSQVYIMPISQRVSEDRLEVHPMQLDPVCLSKALGQIHLDNRRDLADTGASVSATSRLDILHELSTRTSYDIMGYDGRKTRATGQGLARLQNPVTGTVEEMLFVYIPSIQGTIMSLEHHAKTNPNIH